MLAIVLMLVMLWLLIKVSYKFLGFLVFMTSVFLLLQGIALLGLMLFTSSILTVGILESRTE